jgi:Protein of unknown function (DUF2987)
MDTALCYALWRPVRIELIRIEKTKHSMKRHLLLAITASLSLSTIQFATAQSTVPPSVATETTSTQRMDEVIVKSPKNAAVMPYDTVYERLKRFRDSKLDRVKLEVRVTPADENVKQDEIRVALVNDAQNLPLKIAADGLTELPLKDEFYKTDAELRANQPKGKMKVSLGIATAWVPTSNEVEYAEIEECARQLEMAAKDVAGWILYTLFFPSLENVDLPVRYAKPNGQTLDIVKDGRVIKSFKADDKGVLTFRLDRRWREWQPKLVFSELPPKI